MSQRGRARVEYLANRPEICVALEQGRTVRMIYDDMKKNEKITMSYSTFCRYVGGGMRGVQGARAPKTHALPVPQGASAVEQTPQRAIPTAHRPSLPVGEGEFVYNRRANPAELVGIKEHSGQGA